MVVVRHMTSIAVGRSPLIATGMTIYTIDRQVCPGQREIRVLMVKGSLAVPGRVTGKTRCIFIDIAIHPAVLVVGLRIGVTCDTGIDAVIRWVGVAFRAFIPNALVSSAIDREILIVVLCIISRHPGGLCMTGGTFGWEIQG